MANAPTRREAVRGTDEGQAWRRWYPVGMLLLALALSLGSVAVFLTLAESIAEPEVEWFDRRVLAWLQSERGPGLTALMLFLSRVGDGWFLGIVVAITSLTLARRRRRIDAVAVVILLLGALLLNLALKALVGRARPEGLTIPTFGASFPSGHAMLSLCVYGFLAYLTARTRLPLWRRVVTVVAAGMLVLGIGASRLTLGVHWASDVAGGYLAGACWLGGVIAAREYLSSRDRLPWRVARHRQETANERE